MECAVLISREERKRKQRIQEGRRHIVLFRRGLSIKGTLPTERFSLRRAANMILLGTANVYDGLELGWEVSEDFNDFNALSPVLERTCSCLISSNTIPSCMSEEIPTCTDP